MTGKWNIEVGAAALTAVLFCAAGIAAAQGSQSGQSQPGQQQGQQQQQPSDKDKQPNPPPLSMDKPTAPAATPEEESAYKASQEETDREKKIKKAEEFLQKYPQSRYRPAMYQILVSGYYATQQVPKLLDVGEKEIELNPNDAPVLALMAQTIARTYNPKAPDPKQLDKAEQYSRRAIEITPTLSKPENLTDEAFNNAKNDTLQMAHSGLGLVYIREGKFTEAIPELEESIKADTHADPDPVNYYLLGMADKQTSHFDAAEKAFNKCASVQSSLQAACKANADDAKQKASTSLSAPK
jgi:tetratricopeptide (TPR) repeat protein